MRTNLPIDQWRNEAVALGGRPEERPEVPPEYVYMANRMVLLIDSFQLADQETSHD